MCFLLGLWLGTLLSAAAQDIHSLIPLPLEERMQAAELVVEGKVTSRQSFWDSRHENIYTVNQVEVYKVFKGSTSPTTVEVITEGGQVGMDLHVYSATLQLQPQQQGIFFLQPNREKTVVPRYQVFGSLQGFIRYQLPDQTARDPFQQYSSIKEQLYPQLTRLRGQAYRTLRTNPALEAIQKPGTSSNQPLALPLITRLSPTSLRAGTGDVLTITGSNFGASRGTGYVEFKNADDGGKTYIKPLETDYLSWTDTEIRVKVPTYGIDGGTAGSGKIRVANNDPNTATSSDSLTVVFARSNVGYEDQDEGMPLRSYEADHINQNSQGGYTFQLGDSFAANTAAVASFKRAMNSWSCATFINWTVGASASVTRTADDDINSVRFANSGELPSNVLGRCISRYSGCIINGDVSFWVSEMDMEFAPRSDWQYGPDRPTNQQYDFESVTVHELGHGHQLSHLILPRAIMHYAVGRGQMSRTLNEVNDIAGANYVMAQSISQNVCGPAPMVPKDANACAMLANLLSLRATYQENQTVLVDWQAQVQPEDNAFEVERSEDGTTFEVIGTVPISEQTGTRSFTFTDQAPLEGISYYRLRLIKDNNTTELSEAVRVISGQLTQNAPLLLPNPGGSQPRLLFLAQQTGPLTLSFYDASGRLYLTQTVQTTQGDNLFQLVFPELGRGMYLIRWQDSSRSGTLRYVKLD